MNARVLLLIGLLGCAHRAEIASTPPGAWVTIGGERVGVTPLPVRVRTFDRRTAELALTGYRPVTIRLWGVRRKVEVRLVPEHGGAGTWSPEDAK